MNLPTVSQAKYSCHVWDWPLRLFHWALVIAIVGNYIMVKSGSEWIYWHMHFGVFIFSLMVFRVCWGFCGSSTSLFKSFLPTTGRIKKYYLSGKPVAGHSPHAAVSVFSLLLIVFIQTVTGMFAVDDVIDVYGPLYSLVNEELSDSMAGFHSISFDALLFMVALHVLAVFYYSLIKKESVIKPMITGYRPTACVSGVQSKQHFRKRHLVFSISLAVSLYWAISDGEIVMFIKYLQG